jgi:hypothetical protein
MPDASTPSIADDLALALRLADEASALALDLLMRATDSARKADGTVVTSADLAPHVVLVEEAGGRYQDRAGGKDLELPGALLTNGHIEAELDELLGRASPAHTRAWNSIT